MFNRFIHDPTQLAGLLAFATTTIACLTASRRSKSGDAHTWKVLALVNSLFFAEVYFGLRYRVTGIVVAALKANGDYGRLHGLFQEIVIFAVAAIAVVFTIIFLCSRRAAEAAARLATIMTTVVAALFVIETISLHALAPIFYWRIGPIVALGWVWVIAATGISLAALRAARQKSSG